MPVRTTNLVGVTLRIEGQMVASKNVSQWPKRANSTDYRNFLEIEGGAGLVLEGPGKIDGRGYHWWILTLLAGRNKLMPHSGGRPHLVQLTGLANFTVRSLRLKNSMQYHLRISDCTNGTLHGLDIRVNVTAQINLLKYFSLEGVVPMYAFNTDGIDPSGSNMHFYNLTV
jgi:hypothetical protein